jgi:hypothetical protein
MREADDFDRDAFIVEFLSELDAGKEYEGNQIGPEHTLQQINVIADLIEEGHVAGIVIADAMGRPANIGSPRITGPGRAYLKSLRADADAKRPVTIAKTQAKKLTPVIIKWLAGIAAAVAVVYLIKRFGLK